MADLAEWAAQISLAIGSAILASYLTYFLSIRQSAKESVLAERVRLYSPLIGFMNNLPGIHTKEEWQQMEKEVNKLNYRLLLFASDHIVSAFLDTMKTVRKGQTATKAVEFMLLLRKEILGETSLAPESIVSIKFED